MYYEIRTKALAKKPNQNHPPPPHCHLPPKSRKSSLIN